MHFYVVKPDELYHAIKLKMSNENRTKYDFIPKKMLDKIPISKIRLHEKLWDTTIILVLCKWKQQDI